MPVESLEVRSLKTYAATVSAQDHVPYRVTSTNTGGHAATSFHYALGTSGVGLAVDFAGIVPSKNDDRLLAVYHMFTPLIPICTELFYGGPGGAMWKNGHRIYDESLRQEHEDHVHIAVRLGFTFNNPGGTVPVDQFPNYATKAAPVALVLTPSGQGYMILCADGSVFSFGDAPYKGRVQVAS